MDRIPTSDGAGDPLTDPLIAAIDGTMDHHFSPAFGFWGENLDATNPLWTEQTGPPFPEGGGGLNLPFAFVAGVLSPIITAKETCTV